MAAHDYAIDNQAGSAFRADLNNALTAILTRNSASSAPSSPSAHQIWADTTNGVLKRRNSSNTAWFIEAPLASTMVQAKTATYTVLMSDYGTLIDCTNTITMNLTAAATLGDGWRVDIRNSGSGTVTIDPNSSETIDGATTIALAPGDSVTVYCNGTAFKTNGFRSATQGEMETGTAFGVGAAPGNMQWHPGVAKAWGHVTSAGGFNVGHKVNTSNCRTGLGAYAVAFSPAPLFSSAFYTTLLTSLQGSSGFMYVNGQTSSGFNVVCRTAADSANVDTAFNFVCFGDLP